MKPRFQWATQALLPGVPYTPIILSFSCSSGPRILAHTACFEGDGFPTIHSVPLQISPSTTFSTNLYTHSTSPLTPENGLVLSLLCLAYPGLGPAWNFTLCCVQCSAWLCLTVGSLKAKIPSSFISESLVLSNKLMF